MSLKTPDPMPDMSAPSKTTLSPAVLLDSTLRSTDSRYARKDWLAARDCLRLALQVDPNFTGVLGALGSIEFQLQEYQAACATFSAAVRQNPDNPDLHTQLAMAHLQLDCPEAAEAALERALELRPGDPTALKLLADCKRDCRRFQEAGILYGKLINQHPDQAGILLSLAKCFFELGDKVGAQAALQQALIGSSSDTIPRDTQVPVLTKNTEVRAVAKPTPNSAISNATPHPDKPPLLDSILALANSHYARQDWLGAVEFLTLAIEVSPSDSRIHGTLGSLQFQLKDYSAACASFNTVVGLSPDDPDLQTQLAMVHVELNQKDKAKAALQRALNLRPEHPTARQLLGDLDFGEKNYANAAQQYCALLESNPDGVNLLLRLGKCLYELRDLASARWCFERVLALELSNAIASEALQILAASPSREVANEGAVTPCDCKQEGKPIEAAAGRTLGVDPADEEAGQVKTSAERKACGPDVPGGPPTPEREWRRAPSATDLADRKRRNYGHYIEAQLTGRTALVHTPIELFLESSNACNLNCRFCVLRTANPRPRGPSAIMSAAIMGRVVPWLPGVASCSLHGFGEPLLNRYLTDMAHAVVAHRADADFFTNGQLLDERRARELVTARFPRLTVSISSADPALYEKLYERGRFDRLVRNLESLAAEKRRQGTTSPRVAFNAIVTRETLPGLPALIELAGRTGVACVELKPLVTYETLADFHGERVTYLPERDDPILRAAQDVARRYGVFFVTEAYVRTGGEKEAVAPATGHDRHNSDIALRSPCPLVFRTLYVRANGETKPCCFASGERDLSLGNILERPIDEIWNGEAYQSIRRAHLALKAPPVCAHCVKFGLAPSSDSTAAWLNSNGISVPDLSSLRTRWDRSVTPLSQLLSGAEPDKTGDKAAQLTARIGTVVHAIKVLDELRTVATSIASAMKEPPSLILQAVDDMRQWTNHQAREANKLGATHKTGEGLVLADTTLVRLRQELGALDTRARAVWLEQAMRLAHGEAQYS